MVALAKPAARAAPLLLMAGPEVLVVREEKAALSKLRLAWVALQRMAILFRRAALEIQAARQATVLHRPVPQVMVAMVA
jgi:hypothetical protein